MRQASSPLRCGFLGPSASHFKLHPKTGGDLFSTQLLWGNQSPQLTGRFPNELLRVLCYSATGASKSLCEPFSTRSNFWLLNCRLMAPLELKSKNNIKRKTDCNTPEPKHWLGNFLVSYQPYPITQQEDLKPFPTFQLSTQITWVLNSCDTWKEHVTCVPCERPLCVGAHAH